MKYFLPGWFSSLLDDEHNEGFPFAFIINTNILCTNKYCFYKNKITLDINNLIIFLQLSELRLYEIDEYVSLFHRWDRVENFYLIIISINKRTMS